MYAHEMTQSSYVSYVVARCCKGVDLEDGRMSLHSPRSWNLWNEAPDLHDDFNT